MNKKLPLIGLMALLAVGAVTTGTLALVNNSAQKQVNDTLDSAIYLYWGEGSSSASLDNVQNLVSGVKQYRGLAVSPRATKSVAGTLTVTLTLTFEANYSAKGLTIGVYEASSLANAEAGTYDALNDKVLELNCTGYTYSTTEQVKENGSFDITITAGVQTTKYYSIAFDYNGADQDTGYTFGGLATVSQSFN